jgi:hypothetical protein
MKTKTTRGIASVEIPSD